MNTTPLTVLEIATGTHPAASIIWLHGLGADGHDFAPIVQEFQLPFAVRYVLPHAPLLPVTINAGYRMPAWYDIISTDIVTVQDESGIRSTQKQIESLISREVERGIPSDRIILAGFSQGGAMALHTGLRWPNRLAGIIALSTYLPIHHTLDAERSPAGIGTPIFMAHGTDDDIVLPSHARSSRELLISRGHAVMWHEYDMPHTVCAKEADDIRGFMINTLGGNLVRQLP